ncbi:MAG: DUF4445 domain-containing protein [Clostridia bacterium]|nr:DUF4445 domain-containing protein [Clostridia bacterium]
MPILTIINGEERREYPVNQGDSLLDALQKAGVDISFPCAGNHTCGKCRVLAEGVLSAMEEGEKKLLADAPKGTRLACFVQIMGDCSVILAEKAKGERIASDFTADDTALEPIYDGGYGAAFDIGTTTVVGYLFRADSKEPIAVKGGMNRQQAYGADVLSRIVHCNENGVETLRDAIRGQITEILAELCVAAGIAHEEMRGIVITGNTTMMHILAGLPPKSLALAPFTPLSLFDQWTDLSLEGFEGLKAYIPRCISSYVGADITCSILASGIAQKSENILLVDIGTNGEMALQTPTRMVCCSTAAGPAFEGAGISAGSSAKAGAINTVAYRDGKIRYTTIDDAPAKSLCGSGLIDAIAAFLDAGLISVSGRIAKEYGGALPIGDSGISLTQSDIRQLQLAKAAIRAGMDTLLHTCGIEYEDLSRIIFCGGFGSFIDPHSAANIGLIEAQFADRTIAIGNAAGTGAGQILQSRAQFEEARKIAEAAETVELSADAYFSKRYIDCMAFE